VGGVKGRNFGHPIDLAHRKNAIGNIQWPIPEIPPYRRKILADISYTNRVIAIFVQNFVAMATEVGRGKMRLPAFDFPSLKTPI